MAQATKNTPKAKAAAHLSDVNKAATRLRILINNPNSSDEEIHEAALVLERAGCFIRRNADKF